MAIIQPYTYLRSIKTINAKLVGGIGAVVARFKDLEPLRVAINALNPFGYVFPNGVQGQIKWDDEGVQLVPTTQVNEVDFVGVDVTATISGNKVTVTVGVAPYVPTYNLGTSITYTVLAGNDLTFGATDVVTTGNTGSINAPTGVATYGNGYQITGAANNAAIADVATLRALLLALTGTTPFANAAAIEGTYTPGKYKSAGAIGVTAAGTVILNGDGDYVFIAAAGNITFGAGTNIVLTNGARASRVFWVASADVSTTGATSSPKGNFLATDITTGATDVIEGRLLASNDVVIGATNTLLLPTS